MSKKPEEKEKTPPHVLLCTGQHLQHSSSSSSMSPVSPITSSSSSSWNSSRLENNMSISNSNRIRIEDSTVDWAAAQVAQQAAATWEEEVFDQAQHQAAASTNLEPMGLASSRADQGQQQAATKSKHLQPMVMVDPDQHLATNLDLWVATIMADRVQLPATRVSQWWGASARMLLRKETQQVGSWTGKLNDLLLRLLTPLKKNDDTKRF